MKYIQATFDPKSGGECTKLIEIDLTSASKDKDIAQH
jgi:hypothetical protein